jgi:hypothetical protein
LGVLGCSDLFKVVVLPVRVASVVSLGATPLPPGEKRKNVSPLRVKPRPQARLP